MYEVSLQGVTADVTRPTGIFDPVDLAPMSARQLRRLLERFFRVGVLPPTPEDTCPPNLIVSGRAGSFSFTIDAKDGMTSLEAEAPVSVDEALAIASGRLAPDSKRPPPSYPHGLRPVRDPALAATRQNLEPSEIDTTTRPQINHRVWRDSAWRGGSILVLWFAAVSAFLTAVALSPPADVPIASVAGLATLVCLGIWRWTRTKGRETFRMGIDPATNTLWWVRRERVHAAPNANCITELELQTGAGRFDANAEWRLVAVYSSETREELWGTDVLRKNEGKELLAKGRTLFSAAPDGRRT